MNQGIQKMLLTIGAVVLVVVGCIWMFSNPLEHIADTNGSDDYTLTTITDENIIKMDIGALNVTKSESIIGDTETYSSKKFTGVYEVFFENLITNRFDITVNHAQVTEGNFKMVLILNDEIIHEFQLNELTQTFTVYDVNGTISLRIAGESANFKFDYDLY